MKLLSWIVGLLIIAALILIGIAYQRRNIAIDPSHSFQRQNDAVCRASDDTFTRDLNGDPHAHLFNVKGPHQDSPDYRPICIAPPIGGGSTGDNITWITPSTAQFAVVFVNSPGISGCDPSEPFNDAPAAIQYPNAQYAMQASNAKVNTNNKATVCNYETHISGDPHLRVCGLVSLSPSQDFFPWLGAELGFRKPFTLVRC